MPQYSAQMGASSFESAQAQWRRGDGRAKEPTTTTTQQHHKTLLPRLNLRMHQGSVIKEEKR